MVIYSLSLSVLNELAENGTKYMGEVCSDILFRIVKQYLEWIKNAKGTVILIISKEVELSRALMYSSHRAKLNLCILQVRNAIVLLCA